MNLCACLCGCRSAPSRVCVSERASVRVWDVTQARAAQHSSLFKGPFVLLQLVQLLRTDKQDLELWVAKHRPPTPSHKPLWPGPAQHYGSEMDKQTPTNTQTARPEGKFCPEMMNTHSNHHQNQHVSMFFVFPLSAKKFAIWDVSTESLPNSAPSFTISLPTS